MLPYRASVMSSTCRTDTLARYISTISFSKLLYRRLYHSMIDVSKEISLSLGVLRVTSPEVVAGLQVQWPLFIALVPSPLCQFLSLGLQRIVEGVFCATSYQFFDVPLDYFIVNLYNLFRHGLPPSFRMVCRDFILILLEFCKPCLFFLL